MLTCHSVCKPLYIPAVYGLQYIGLYDIAKAVNFSGIREIQEFELPLRISVFSRDPFMICYYSDGG